VHELRAAIASAQDEARRLAELARRLLDLSLADDGALLLDLRRADVAPIAADAARRFAPRAQLDGRTVRFEGGNGAVACDRERIAEVLDLLVDNALVHGAGDVVLRVDSEDGWVRMSVADEGAGFPEGSEDEALGRFVSFHAGSDHAGLGLSIAKAVVDAHGGKLELHRTTHCTVVAVLIPREPVEEMPAV